VTPRQKKEHAALVDAADKPTPVEIAEQRAAETEWLEASKALANYEARRPQ
jgi:hypothetical protein